jgi:hypothetical protein
MKVDGINRDDVVMRLQARGDERVSVSVLEGVLVGSFVAFFSSFLLIYFGAKFELVLPPTFLEFQSIL